MWYSFLVMYWNSTLLHWFVALASLIGQFIQFRVFYYVAEASTKTKHQTPSKNHSHFGQLWKRHWDKKFLLVCCWCLNVDWHLPLVVPFSTYFQSLSLTVTHKLINGLDPLVFPSLLGTLLKFSPSGLNFFQSISISVGLNADVQRADLKKIYLWFTHSLIEHRKI